MQPIVKRGATILNPGKTEKESSLQDRDQETSEAWETARDHLLLGVGAGVPFGIELQQPVISGSFIVGVTRSRSCSCTTSTSTWS